MHFALAAALYVAAAAPAGAAGGGPIDWNPGAAQIQSQCPDSIAILQRRVALAAAAKPRTFARVVLPLENAVADAEDALGPWTFLASVAPDKAERDAARACSNQAADALAAIQARPDLYAAVAAAAAGDGDRNVYDRKLASLWLETLVAGGAALPAKKRAEFVRLAQELAHLESAFAANLAEAAATITIARRQTGGIPTDLLAAYGRDRSGGYVVPVNESTLAFLQYATDEDARKAYYVAYNRRAAKADVALFERAIAIRDRMAHLLGYETWAAYRLSTRMAGSPENVEKFLRGATAALGPPANAQIEAMRVAIGAERRDPSAQLQPWDVRRGEYLVQKAAAADPQAVRQYFPVQHTIEAVLDVYHTLLGIDFVPVVPADAWAPGVLEYRVTDTATGKPLGITYFDLYPRPGKFEHFASYPILPVRGGASRLPVAAIVGNWPQPAPGSPALLSHADVVTFFHEFGHDVATLLAAAPYETLTDGFREDFVEAPSQMLENFAWQPVILQRITSNWRTGEPMPSELIARLVASRDTTDAYDTLRLVTMASIDLQYHSSGPRVDTTAVWAAASAAHFPLLYYPQTYPQVAFGHLMGGYDAGLYAYPWAKVYAQDLFTAFAGAGLLDPAVGMRYRQDILAPARTYEPDDEVRAFLGRGMSPNAFYAEFGVTAPAAP